jgi:hypothetical protein
MIMEAKENAAGHLSDAELFTLALPPAGEPEALPRHLSDCSRCSRAFAEWKTAVRELAEEDTEALRTRSQQEWEALERRTIDAIARSRIGGFRVSTSQALAAAAVVTFFAIALPLWRGRESASRSASSTPAAQLSTQDQADDTLLKDVARLSRAEDDSSRLWSSLAPEPSSNDDDRL